jgi:predicted TIM-barrel fold metal-dependent hydrolase
MRRATLLILVAVIGLTGAAEQQPQQTAPSADQQPGRGRGQRGRPGEGREPEWPVPRITEYKPRSTLVVPQHPAPRAKFPAIDVHSHQPTPISEEQFDAVVGGMDQLNLQLLVNVSGASGDRLRESLDAIHRSRHKDRMVQFTNIIFRDVGPGFGQKAAQQLEADIKAGAPGVGEISKGFGLRVRKTDGTRLKLDDAELDPIWETCARLNVPVLIHTADPQEFFQPIDYENERWLELALYPDRRYPASEYPSFEELVAERDRLFERHPRTRFIAAHLGWHANDLARLGRLFDRLPNLHAEVGAVLAELGRQPRFAHDFFVKYQDRILFGKDSYQPDEFPYYWRTFETADEYFDYYRSYHAFWKLYGLALPDEVLKKLYYKNAIRLIPGLPKTGFPD